MDEVEVKLKTQEYLRKLVGHWPSDWIEDEDRRELILERTVPIGYVPAKEDVEFVKSLLPPNNAESQVVADWLDARLLGIPEDTDPDDGLNVCGGMRSMVDLFRVTVHLYDHHDNAQLHKVYGEITVTDLEGRNVQLFKQGKESTSFVPEGSSLPLSVSKASALSLSTAKQIKLCLRDADDDAEIANGSFSVDYDTLSDYNQAIDQTITGEYGCATVHYAKLACAGFTMLGVKLSGFSGDVYGSLVSYCTNIRGKEKQPSVVCIMPKNEPVNVVDTGTNIALSRPILCVPPFSNLVYEANIWDHATGVKLADEVVLELELREFILDPVTKQMKGINGLLVEVEMEWFHPYELYPNEFSASDDVCVHQPLQSRAWTNLSPTTSTVISYNGPGNMHVEVYSIAVGGYTNDFLNIYGEITISDGLNLQCIFLRGENWPLRLEEPYSKLPRTSSHLKVLGSDHFEIMLNLKDTNGHIVSKGSILWCAASFGRKNWYDRRLCSVIKGDVGFAVAHYTFFVDAVEAKVRVYICTNDSTRAKIKAQVVGRIDAYYPEYRYTNAYDRRFYQRTLFEKSASVICMPYAKFSTDCSTLDALVADAVVVPKDTPLAFKSHLRVRLSNESDFTTADIDDVEFQVSSRGSFCKASNQGKYSIIICVDWLDYFYPGPRGGNKGRRSSKKGGKVLLKRGHT